MFSHCLTLNSQRFSVLLVAVIGWEKFIALNTRRISFLPNPPGIERDCGCKFMRLSFQYASSRNNPTPRRRLFFDNCESSSLSRGVGKSCELGMRSNSLKIVETAPWLGL